MEGDERDSGAGGRGGDTDSGDHGRVSDGGSNGGGGHWRQMQRDSGANKADDEEMDDDVLEGDGRAVASAAAME